jgi:hypothetical protein
MSSIIIFKSSFVHTLRSSVRLNLDKYLQDAPWAEDVMTAGGRDLQTGIDLGGSISLDLPEAGNLKDTENAIRFHKVLRQLTPLQARDPRLWTRMSHVDFWQYMRARWPVNRHMADKERAVRFVESRYFVPQSQSRALLRNGIARLWWTAQMSHDRERENPYELTAILLSMLDITQQILERGMGRADNVIKAFLEFLLRNSATLLTGGDLNRSRIRRLAKHLNMYGGVSVLDSLNKSDIMELLDAELNRAMHAEAS